MPRVSTVSIFHFSFFIEFLIQYTLFITIFHTALKFSKLRIKSGLLIDCFTCTTKLIQWTNKYVRDKVVNAIKLYLNFIKVLSDTV